ncbi:hypothetical protein ACFJGW_10185 [Burkholderiaceae bacterium UC74_6]
MWLTPLIPVVTAWAWTLARVQARCLIWDGQGWPLAAPDAVDEPCAARLELLFDLGSWLLLRADGPIYLPLARREVPNQWTQLRATLVTARPHNPGP